MFQLKIERFVRNPAAVWRDEKVKMRK